MRSIWFWWLVSCGLVAGGLEAATVIEKEVVIHIRDDGRLSETTRLHLRLDSPGDLESKARHVIPLDESQTLVRVDAYAVQPDGSRSKVGRRQRDTVETTLGDGVFHDSRRFEVLELEKLQVGSEVHIAYEVETAPYFPASVLALREAEPIAKLRVELRSEVPGWRYHLAGRSDDLEISELEDGLVVSGENVAEVETSDWGPRGLELYSALHYAWGAADDWRAVGDWYRDLLAEVPAVTDAVRAKARELIATAPDPRARLELLLDFMRRQVRYVAVEIGIGGYQPSPPEEVLERRWGDCKDKSTLLIALLAEAGITAYPALIQAGERSRIEPAFASPAQFNHLIVAVPQEAVATAGGDPVAAGYLWLDPTQTRGSAAWLNTWVQDQYALIVEPRGERLVETPSRGETEELALSVTLTVDGQGHATGNAGLSLQGGRAIGLLEQSTNEPVERLAESIRAIFAQLQPGAGFANVRWGSDDRGIPRFETRVDIEQRGFVEGLTSSAPSLRLAGTRLMPSASDLRDREDPVVLRPGISHMIWHVQVPEGWCVPEASTVEIMNELGSFRQIITPRTDPNGFTVERRVEVAKRWVPLTALEGLRELAQAERRAHLRRIRLSCGVPNSD